MMGVRSDSSVLVSSSCNPSGRVRDAEVESLGATNEDCVGLHPVWNRGGRGERRVTEELRIRYPELEPVVVSTLSNKAGREEKLAENRVSISDREDGVVARVARVACKRDLRTVELLVFKNVRVPQKRFRFWL